MLPTRSRDQCSQSSGTWTGLDENVTWSSQVGRDRRIGNSLQNDGEGTVSGTSSGDSRGSCLLRIQHSLTVSGPMELQACLEQSFSFLKERPMLTPREIELAWNRSFWSVLPLLSIPVPF
jgi:hypothetical protein